MTKHYSCLAFSLPLLVASLTLRGTAGAQEEEPAPAPPPAAPTASASPPATGTGGGGTTDSGKNNPGKNTGKNTAGKNTAGKNTGKITGKVDGKGDGGASLTVGAAATGTGGGTQIRLDDLAAGHLDVPASTLQSGGLPSDSSKCQVPGELIEGGAKLRLNLKQLGAGGTQCLTLINASPKQTTVAVSVGTGAAARHALLELSPDVGSEEAAVIKLTLRNGEVIPAKAAALTASAGIAPALYWLNGTQWQKVAADGNNKLKLPSDLAALVRESKQPYNVFVNFNGNGFTSPGATRATIPGGGAVGNDDNGKKRVRPPRNWCKRNPVGYTVCLDFYDDALSRKNRRVSVFPDHTNHVLPPNTSIRVVVLRRIAATTTMELGGEQGVFISTDRDLTQKPGLDQQSGDDQQEKAPDFDIDEQEFAPRLPGNANLTVTLTEDGKEQARTVEFVVDTTYIGAVRVGAALVFNATDRSYEARAVAGSKQSEIAVSKKSSQDIELVVGYSAYLSPRGYANPSWSNFEPYVGIGVLNQGPTALETLKSLHFGLEWEPSPNFGIAATGVVRRVDRLADGYRVGSPISGSVPTVEKAELGFGIVFNLSPDFLRIAKQSGSTFFK